MKVKLLPKYSCEEVQSYWKRINAPVSLRHTYDTDCVMKRPGCSSAAANAFLVASSTLSDLDKDVFYRKLGSKSPVLDPIVVIDEMHGKML